MTTAPLPNNTEARRPDVGLDAALNALHAEFNRGWLFGPVFLRAYENTFPGKQGGLQTSPQVYLGNGQYYNCLPNDNYTHTLFFRTDGPERTNLDKEERRGGRAIVGLATRPLSLVFWCDLTRIGPGYGGDYLYTEEIKEEFIKRLYALPCVKSIEGSEDTSFERVFEGYDMPDEKKQYNKFPFACLRIDFTVAYRLNC